MNRVWFVTGASSGFGRALAQRVLDRGERAIITARRADALTQVAQNHPKTALAGKPETRAKRRTR